MKKVLAFIWFLSVFSLAFAQESDSLSLQNAIDNALKNNYGIITVQKNIDVATERNSWGNAGALPTISFVGAASQTNNYNDNDDFTSQNLSATVEMNWVLFRGFAVRIQKDMLGKYEQMAEVNLAVMVENTIVDVVLAYNNIWLQIKQMEIAEASMNLSLDRYEREKMKNEIGNKDTYELLQAQNAYLEDKSDFMLAQTSVNNAIRQLNYVMGVSIENTYAYSTGFEPDTTAFDFSDLLNKMTSNNHTLRNQYINLELAKLSLKSARSDYYPTVVAGVSGGYSNTDLDYATMNTMDNQNSAYTVGANVAVSYDIFSGGTRRTAVNIAKIEQEIAEVETRDMEQTLKNQLAQEFELYNVRKELLALAAENLKAAELNLSLSKEKFENGVISSFNFRDVQTLYENAALNYENAKYNLIQSYYSLMKLTGGVLEEQ